MKYGEQLEQESAPQWSLYNIDYNSLKHEIKAHTMRDQGTAIAIPGQQDQRLGHFENGFYDELCRQHDRVHLFVVSKADEISRRLDELSSSIRRWLNKRGADDSIPVKHQRKYLKLERALEQCGNDIHSLSRFSNAQVVAFRKILKKYKKWTGSTTLGSRFNQVILSDPKSFSRRDYSGLRNRYQEIRSTLKASSPQISEPSSPSSNGQASPETIIPRTPQVTFEELPPPHHEPRVSYWNEYEYGSEAGDCEEDEYAIYINPSDHATFPTMANIKTALTLPLEQVKAWFIPRDLAERRPLLDGSDNNHPTYTSYPAPGESDEQDLSSVDGLPSQGYNSIYALPSVDEQKTARYRENALYLGSIAFLLVSYALLFIAGLLISTGKHKLRVEVDAGVTLGVVVSLFCACSALGMMLYRRDKLGIVYPCLIGAAFVGSCVINGMLLVLVVGNAP